MIFVQFKKQSRCPNDESGVPKGSRTPVAWMKTRSPRPLDDGDIELSLAILLASAILAMAKSYVNITSVNNAFSYKNNYILCN